MDPIELKEITTFLGTMFIDCGVTCCDLLEDNQENNVEEAPVKPLVMNNKKNEEIALSA